MWKPQDRCNIFSVLMAQLWGSTLHHFKPVGYAKNATTKTKKWEQTLIETNWDQYIQNHDLLSFQDKITSRACFGHFHVWLRSSHWLCSACRGNLNTSKPNHQKNLLPKGDGESIQAKSIAQPVSMITVIIKLKSESPNYGAAVCLAVFRKLLCCDWFLSRVQLQWIYTDGRDRIMVAPQKLLTKPSVVSEMTVNFKHESIACVGKDRICG